ncbi:response regulator [Telluria aromaticivorans]|uniref:response regulator n=1 Tax=Telluria aromaticivorans TaxID=2725995 RepID=UPI003530C4EE
MNNKPLILVVDDEVDITETYALYLGFEGFEVITANNALQAIELLASRTPALIISDCMMPHMDGVELSVQVKARPSTRNTPIILMSGAPERHDLDSPSYEVFLRKPVFFDRLMPEIRRLLAGRTP